MLRGVNASVVGLLIAALYNPVWTAGITAPYDFALAVAAFLLLFMWQTPPWLVVVLSGGELMHCVNSRRRPEHKCSSMVRVVWSTLFS